MGYTEEAARLVDMGVCVPMGDGGSMNGGYVPLETKEVAKDKKFQLEQRWYYNEAGHFVEIDSYRPIINPDDFDPAQNPNASPRYASWKVKDFSVGEATRSPYRRDDSSFAGGYSGFKPRWKPDGHPVYNGKSSKIYETGYVAKPGYMGFRPGEKADPFIDPKAGIADERNQAPWQNDCREKSMATRIAQRRLDKRSPSK